MLWRRDGTQEVSPILKRLALGSLFAVQGHVRSRPPSAVRFAVEGGETGFRAILKPAAADLGFPAKMGQRTARTDRHN